MIQSENGTFTPLVFATNGSMGREYKKFYNRLAEMMADKRHLPHSVTVNKIRKLIFYSLLRSTVRCIRGSRGRPLPQNDDIFTDA